MLSSINMGMCGRVKVYIMTLIKLIVFILSEHRADEYKMKIVVIFLLVLFMADAIPICILLVLISSIFLFGTFYE